MKSGLRTLRLRLATASTAALLLAGAPRCARAQQLRRGGPSAAPESAADDVAVKKESIEMVYSHGSRMLQDEDGFEIVGHPLEHDPNNRDFWRRSMLRESEEKVQAADPKERSRSVLREDKVAKGEAEDEESAEPKERIIDDSLTFVDPNEGEHERRERSCDSENELLWVFSFLTDRYGYETSWKLERKNEDGIFQKLASGPPGRRKYHDNTQYTGSACLTGDMMYKLTIFDQAKDGICCGYGSGNYVYEVGGFTQFDSSQDTPFADKEENLFYVGKPVPSSPLDDMPPFGGRSGICGENEHRIGLKIQTDKYGEENTWELRNLETDEVLRQKGLYSYGDGSTDEMAICVPDGRYRFKITDGIGDGICCKYGDGQYHLYMDDRLMIYGSDFNSGKTREHDIVVGYDSRYTDMSEREIQWLNAHNWRRKKYHERFGASYVPLKYDMSLAAHAQKWANDLLDDCEVHGIKHEPGVIQGENLAKNTGSGKWGKRYPVENIARRWFEREETWGWPENAHLTQGLWRSGRYVGCAESEKTMENGGTCRIQVCRYARAGNCSMRTYNSSTGDNWKTPMLMEHNPCGPVCPPDGCH